MSKNMPPSTDAITRGQIDRLYDRFVAKLCKSQLPSVPTQYVLENECDELCDKFVASIRRRVEARIRAIEPHILERIPFNPTSFMGYGWTILERVGVRIGGNLDASKITRKDYLKQNESFTNGEKRLNRIKANLDAIQCDEQDFLALYKEKGQKTLRWLYETQGINCLSFWGVILQGTDGDRYVLTLNRYDDGSWFWRGQWLGGKWSADDPSAVLLS